MIITRTPHRVSLAGGGTDLPAWYRTRRGAVVGFTLAQYCYISLRALPPYHASYRHRIVWSKIELVNELWEIEHPAIAAVLADQCVEEGLEIHHAGDVPARAGLGSSSAFTVGLLNALEAHRGRRITRDRLAAEATRIEQDVIHEAVGSQDQAFAAFGGFNRIDFDASGVRVAPLILPPGREAEILGSLLLLYTTTQRTASEVEARKIAAVEAGANNCALERMLDLVDECEAALTAPVYDHIMLGHILHEGWRLKRGLASGVSTDLLDDLYTAAFEAGASGGKILGAGGGGCLLLCVDPERRSTVLTAMPPGLVEIPLVVDRGGSRVVVYEPGEFR
jgi:D-glycero-alpha-D-manno-heptose-7-phosphate kinase